MHVRLSQVRRGQKVYRYAQLVESYRRPDGMPAHRVLANLGSLSDLEVENLRAALAASREGCPLVFPQQVRPLPLKVRSNLRYLDVAVLLDCWRWLGLDRIVASCLPADAEVAPADVVAALAFQRCTAPASKLAAVDWFANTALPELLGIPRAKFNNSRLHRVLDVLDDAEGEIQARLPALVRSRSGEFISLFLDVTDTWFEGRGPDIAGFGIDKEGIYRRRIGIALLCDQRGMPLRWRTLPGEYRDPTALADMLSALAPQDWVRGCPVVLDRAMGRARSINFLEASGLRYLTALPVDEFGSIGAELPWERIAAVADSLEDGSDDRVAKARAAAEQAGLMKVSATRYVLDLGLIPRVDRAAVASRAIEALRRAMALERASDRPASEIAAELGIGKRSLRIHRALCRLIPEVRGRILRGEADAFSVEDVHAVAARDATEQLSAYAAVLETRRGSPRLTVRGGTEDATRRYVRFMLHFNPERFVEERRTAMTVRTEIEGLVASLNRDLASPSCRRSDEVVLREVREKIEQNSYLDVFSCAMEVDAGVRRLVLSIQEAKWTKRARFHGFNLLAAHAELQHSAAELVELYFAKDVVEKDFQTIKSVIELRPVRHRTDAKVRAHVTLCMLALMLERALEGRLGSAGRRRTAESALRLLSSCHLNVIDAEGADAFTVTIPTPDQRQLLKSLELARLVDDAAVAGALTPS